MSDDLRVALIGAGVIARSSHLPAWEAASGATVTCVVDVDVKLAERVARKWGVTRWTADLSEALDLVDAVDICLPPGLHQEFVLEALRRDTHVLVEKPLAVDMAECAAILAAHEESSTTLMVAENWPYSSAARAVRDLLDEGTIGEPFLVQANHQSSLYCPDLHPEQPAWLTDPRGASGGGYLLNAGIHTVALCRHLLGDVAAVATVVRPAAGATTRFDLDSVSTIEFVGGALGTFTFTGRSRHFGPRRLSMELFAQRGTVRFDVLTGRVEVLEPERATMTEPTPVSMGFTEEVQHFVDCVRTGKRPLTSARDQVRTLATVEAMYTSAAKGGRRIVLG